MLLETRSGPTEETVGEFLRAASRGAEPLLWRLFPTNRDEPDTDRMLDQPVAWTVAFSKVRAGELEAAAV